MEISQHRFVIRSAYTHTAHTHTHAHRTHVQTRTNSFNTRNDATKYVCVCCVNCLMCSGNQMGDEGARALGDALTTNTTLTILALRSEG